MAAAEGATPAIAQVPKTVRVATTNLESGRPVAGRPTEGASGAARHAAPDAPSVGRPAAGRPLSRLVVATRTVLGT